MRCQYEQSKTSPAQGHHCTCPRLLLSMKEVPLWMRVLSSQTVQCWPSIEKSPSCLLSIVVSLAIGRCCTPSVQVLYFTADVGVCIGRQRHAFKALQTVCAVDFVHKLQAFHVRMLGCWARRHIFTCFHHFRQTPIFECDHVTLTFGAGSDTFSKHVCQQVENITLIRRGMAYSQICAAQRTN